jgi:AraC-like DNA-binding protein
MNALLPKFLDVVMPWAMRHQWAPGQRYKDSDYGVEMYSLWLFLEGDAHVTLGGREWHIVPGMASLWPCSGQREISTENGAMWLSIRLRATLWGDMDLLQLLWPPVVWQPEGKDYRLLHHAMESLVDEWSSGVNYPYTTPATIDSYLLQRFDTWNSRDTTSMLLCDAYVKTIVGLCWRMLGKVDLEDAAGTNFPVWLGPVLERLREQPDTSIEQLAQGAGISPTQLRRQFQKWFGTSPRDYLNRLRLEEARQLLESSELTANEIAERIGFLSLSHFNRAFKAVFGMPPARYRVMSRSQGTSNVISA